MLKVTLKLNKEELQLLYIYSNQAFAAWSDPTNRPYMIGYAIQIAENYERVRKQIYTWHTRPRNKEYSNTLSVSLACAYHQWLQRRPIQSIHLPTLLAKLDTALIDCHIKPQTVESYD